MGSVPNAAHIYPQNPLRYTVMKKTFTRFVLLLLSLVGLNTHAAIYIVGDAPFGDWNPAAGVEMTPQGNGVYSYTTASINGSVYFVFADGLSSDWAAFNSNYRYGPSSGNETVTPGLWHPTQKAGDHGAYRFVGTTGENYKITFDETNHQFMVEGYVEPGPDILCYTVVGSHADIFGQAWNPKLTENDMTKGADGIYRWSKKNVRLQTGTFEFKVVGNRDWYYAWPVDNWVARIDYEGIYNIVITFNPESKEITYTHTLIEEIDPVEHTYTVVGTSNLFGTEWDITNEANDMVKGANGIYTWAKAGVKFTARETAEFKVVQDHAWTYSWPSSNWWYQAPEDGIYNAAITFNPAADDMNKISFTAIKTGEVEIPDVYIIGEVNNLMWDGIHGVKMKYDNGIYTASITTQGNNDGKSYFGFTKKLADPSSENPWEDIVAYRFGPASDGEFFMTEELLGVECPLATDDSNNAIAIEKGTWEVTVDLENNTFCVERGNSVPEPLFGDLNGDGSVNISDINVLINQILTDTQDMNNDLNGDGEVNIGDVSLLIDEILDGIVQPKPQTSAPEYVLELRDAQLWCDIEGEGDIFINNENYGPAPVSYLVATQAKDDQEGSFSLHAIAQGKEPSETLLVNWELPAIPAIQVGFGDMYQVDDNSQVSFIHDATVLWQFGLYTYAMDETGYGLIYGDVGQTYQQGDVIPAGFGGEKTTYMNEPEVMYPTGFEPATHHVNVSPQVISTDEVNHKHWAHYVLIKNVSIAQDEDPTYHTRAIVDEDGNSALLFNYKFNTPLPLDLSVNYDIYGIVASFDNLYEVFPISFEPAEQPIEVTPTPAAELVRTGAELWCNVTGEGDIYVDDVLLGPAPVSFLIATQGDNYQDGSFTVRAIAPDKEPSIPITVNWELEAKPVEGFGFVDMLSTPDNTQVVFSRDAIVLWQHRYYLFAMDDTGFGLIYGDTGQTYRQGDVIPAGFGGKKMLYMGEPEIQNPVGLQPAIDNVIVSPLVISLEDIGHSLWSHYVVVKNVTIGDQDVTYGVRTITDVDGFTGSIYSGTFFIDLPEDLNQRYDIYGIINCYKSMYQILPTQFVPVE